MTTTKRFGLAGMVSGIISPAILYIAAFWLDAFALFYLYLGPGLIYSLCTILATGKISSPVRRLVYLVAVTGAYVLAVLLYLHLIDGLTSDRIAAGTAGLLGGGLVILFTRILIPVKNLFRETALGASIGALCAVVVPISWGDWVPSVPYTWVLFPLWQTAVAAYTGKILTSNQTTALATPAQTPTSPSKLNSETNSEINLTEQK